MLASTVMEAPIRLDLQPRLEVETSALLVAIASKARLLLSSVLVATTTLSRARRQLMIALFVAQASTASQLRVKVAIPLAKIAKMDTSAMLARLFTSRTLLLLVPIPVPLPHGKPLPHVLRATTTTSGMKLRVCSACKASIAMPRA